MLKRLTSLIIVSALILSAFSVVSVFSADELFSLNFESDGGWSPWSATGAELNTISTEVYSEGAKALYMSDDSSELTAGIKTDRINVTPGESYTALCDFYLVSGNISVNLRFYDASGKQLSSKSGKGVQKKWVNIAITDIAPSDAATCDIVIASVKASKAFGYVDNIKVLKGVAAAGTISNAKVPESTATDGASEATTAVTPEEDGIDEGTLIYSYGFENGLGSWTYATSNSNSYVTEITTTASEGKMAVAVNDPDSNVGPGIASEKIPVSEGNSYTTVGDFIGKGGTIKLFNKYYNASGTLLSSLSTAIPASAAWTSFPYTTKAPADACFMEVVICGIKASTGEVYADNIQVYKGSIKIEAPETEYIEPKQVAPVNAHIVAPVDNKLKYNTYNEYGDTLGDYSYGGFAAGKYNLPESANIPVVMEISPTGTKDDTQHIQAAIDKIYNEASDDNFKILKLKAGTYYINKSGIRLKSGIVLSGEGQGPTGTILYAYEAVKNTPVMVSGIAPATISDKYYITDSYVKSGSKTINLSAEDIKNFKVGDLITIVHPSTEKWVEGMRMINIENSSKGDNSWKAGAVDMPTERTITAINGTEITLDFALFVPYNKEYSDSYIVKNDDSQRVRLAGVQNLRIESFYNGDPTDENHGNTAISFTNAKDCFVRDVSVKHFVLSAVALGACTKQITVLNVSSLEPISIVQGSRRYAFSNSTSAQQNLFAGCYSYDGRHDYEASFTVTGPIVFVDSVIDKSNSSAETHGTWSTGVLYDNIYQVPNDTSGYLCLANRGIYGTSKSQGWTAGGSVMWNTLSNLVIVHKPPMTYQNFMVGTWGIYDDQAAKSLKTKFAEVYRKYFRTTDYYNAQNSHYATNEGTSFVGDAYKEAEFTPVEPRSLYKAQLSERFTGVISNARPNAPVIVYPRPDKETKDSMVEISGIYQLGATAVTVYIDNTPHNATMDSSDNSFKLSLSLSEGVHKIYATQVIGGAESTKTADRFITVGKANGNPDYLQSIYTVDKTALLINDPRPTYDVYEKQFAEENKNKVTVMVNSRLLQSDVEPFIENGRTLVPMRAIFEALRAEVLWDAESETATATLRGTEVKITKNQTVAYVNGNPITLDVPAQIKDGRFVVPVRFISESFGAKVEWIAARRTAMIDGGIKFPANHGLAGELDVYDLVQSGDDGAGSIINNTMDNNFTTNWGVAYDEKNPDGAFGIFDLGGVVEIGSMYIAFHKGNTRVYTIDFYASDDGVNYTPVKMDFKSAGQTDEFEEIPLNVKARFIKLVGRANSENQWTNLKEIAFTGK